jgi:protein TonB
VFALVLLLHGAACFAWMKQPQSAPIALNEMSVSVFVRQAEVAQLPVQPVPKLQPAVESDEQHLSQPVQEAVATAPQPVAVAALPIAAAADSEPDYKAAYLNNPRPPYPMVARRMGYHGKVMLSVEVLDEGYAGQVLLHSSSGYSVLDNAALQTVKSWRFTPARQAGRAVTKWFIVPVNFALKDNEA